MIKAVLFDMDGVLYNSMPGHAKAWEEAIRFYNIPCTYEEFYLHEGRTGHSTIDLLFQRHYGRNATLDEKTEIYALKSKLFQQYNKHRIMDGALEVLKKTKESGLKIILVTGSAQESLLDKISSDFPGFFHEDLMVTGNNVVFGKPHPEPYLLGLQKGQITKEEAIVVENAPMGVESSKAAGIYTIAVNTGPLETQILKDAGADCIFSSMNELAEDFDKLLNTINSSK